MAVPASGDGVDGMVFDQVIIDVNMDITFRANLLAKTVLTSLLPYIPENQQALAVRVKTLVAAIGQGITEYGIQTLPSGEQGIAFTRVDGHGHACFHG